MFFTDGILKYKSCSIVGMAKNCGKTVVLNHIISCLQKTATRIAVTSIGLDGETKDSITLTAKPEIILGERTFFATSEGYYDQRQLISQIIASTDYWSPLGRILIGEVLEKGKLIISGPSDTFSTRLLIDRFHKLGADLILVDGALSRKTSASPIVTDSLILCTGAALSLNINELVRKTVYTYELISLKPVETNKLIKELENIDSGIWAITSDGEIVKGADSIFDLKGKISDLLKIYDKLFFTGMLTSNILESVITNRSQTEIIVHDFTKIFITPQLFNKFIAKGGQIKVLHKAELIGVCINPVSPTGHVLSSDELIDRLQQRLNIGVYDVKKYADI